LEVDGLVEIGKRFDYPTEALKKGTKAPVSETKSNGSSCSNTKEAFNNLTPEEFSSKGTLSLKMICHLIGSNNR
jgi:hypothetical protein